MKINNHVKRVLEYGATITFGWYYIHRSVDFYTGVPKIRVWCNKDLQLETHDFEELKKNTLKI